MIAEKTTTFAAVLLAALWLPFNALADVYELEMIIFERPGGGDNEYWPDVLDETPVIDGAPRLASMAAGSRQLAAEAASLGRRGMKVLEHIVWRQTPGGRDSERWYSVEANRLYGLLRVTRGRFLHLETDLVLSDAATAQPYRIRLHRRMRSDELHYVDHPKLGILIQANRYEPEQPANPPDEQTGEPAPAQPITKDTGS
jgi:hypothetical protein